MPELTTTNTAMQNWGSTELLSHIQRLTPCALEMVDGTDPNAQERIDHAQDQIQQAIDILQSMGYPFEYKAREKLRFVRWKPTSIDIRLMVRALINGDKPDHGTHPGDYLILLAPQGDCASTTRQYRAIGEIIIEHAIRQGITHQDAAREWLNQVPNAVKGGCIELAVPTDTALWQALGQHLHQYPETQITAHCTIAKCKGIFANIHDLVRVSRIPRERGHQGGAPAHAQPAQGTQASSKPEQAGASIQAEAGWLQRIFS